MRKSDDNKSSHFGLIEGINESTSLRISCKILRLVLHMNHNRQIKH